MKKPFVLFFVIASAIVIALYMTRPTPLEQVKAKMGTRPFGECLPYATEAIWRLELKGIDARLRFFQCPESLHAAACTSDGLCLDSAHKSVVRVEKMGCPLAVKEK